MLAYANEKNVCQLSLIRLSSVDLFPEYCETNLSNSVFRLGIDFFSKYDVLIQNHHLAKRYLLVVWSWNIFIDKKNH